MSNKNLHNEQHWMLLVVLLETIAKKKGIKNVQLAEMTGLQKSNISRIFSLRYSPNLKTFITLARALKVNFFFEEQGEDTIEFNELMEEAMDELGRRIKKINEN